MEKFLFTRLITKREPINKFGKLGYTTHKEAVIIVADSLEKAKEELEPFNYKKHIKFSIDYDFKRAYDTLPTGQLVDLGIIEE